VIQALDEEPDRFRPDIVHLVELLATAAASAIENARLFQETRQRADRLAVLTQISAAINQPLDLNDVVQAAVRELTRALHVSQTGLALFDPTRQHLIIVADVPASGSPPVFGVEIPVEGNASMQYILATGMPLAIEDAQHDPRTVSIHELMRQRRVQSILIVPLIARGEVIGTFGCDAVDEPHRFTQEDIDLTLTVANLIAVRIEQARLFEAERDQRRLAEALRDSAAVLNQTLYFDEVLDRVLDTLEHVASHDAANIMLIDEHGVARMVRDRATGQPLAISTPPVIPLGTKLADWKILPGAPSGRPGHRLLQMTSASFTLHRCRLSSCRRLPINLRLRSRTRAYTIKCSIMRMNWSSAWPNELMS
jgi:GAF domain-containing protein